MLLDSCNFSATNRACSLVRIGNLLGLCDNWIASSRLVELIFGKFSPRETSIFKLRELDLLREGNSSFVLPKFMFVSTSRMLFLKVAKIFEFSVKLAFSASVLTAVPS